MRKRKNIFFIPLLALGFYACGNGSDSDHGAFQMDNLVGKWKDASKKHAYHEVWSRTGDSLVGSGFVLAEQDTVFIENLEIVEEGSTWIYTARVHNQKDAEAIYFSEVENTKNRIVFSNPDHDFPQRIVYEVRSDSVLNVLVDGEEYGEYRKLEFDYRKME